MNIVRLRANHLENPVGYDLSDLSLSWVVEDTAAKRQDCAEIIISKDPNFSIDGIVYTSERCKAADSLSFQPDISLEPCTRYYWKVQVWGDNRETAVSETAWFETGKMDQPWEAIWITPDLEDDVHPYLRKGFEIHGKIREARAYVSAAGIYELEINGQKISDEYLLPGYSAYDCWMQYQTFEVTEYLNEGKNAIGAILGPGWFSGRFGLGNIRGTYGTRMAFLCELVITMEDGHRIVIATDESWKSHPGPILTSGIYDGEHYDANLEIPDWSKASCDETSWSGVRPIELKIGPMAERLNPPIIKHESFKPVEIIHTPKGEIVLDFGQNMTGWVEFDAHIPKGSQVFLQYGELMQDGCFYRENLRSAKAEYLYISNGNPAHIRPHFTFYGFRYVKVEGVDPRPEDFIAYVIHSQTDYLGEIITSDERVNRLILNARWGQKGNFLDVPTDCPQRDERLGWTGDAQVFSGTACFFADTAAFYTKYLKDLREEQKLLKGSVPIVVPRVKNQRDIGEGHGSCAWGDAATIIPWNVYLYFGDKSLLAKHYHAMKDWVDYIKRKDDEDGGKRLWQTGMHIADWLALDNPDPDDIFTGGTDNYFVASAYYCYSAGLTAEAAKVLGKTEDAEYYGKLHEEIRSAIQREYFTPNGKISIDTQTAHVLALFMDLIPAGHRARVTESLKTKLIKKGVHLDTGFVGTTYLCRTLSNNGANEYAYKLLMNDDFPSWLYQVNMGATTIWERWNSLNPDGHVSSTGMNSMNHYAYGSVVEWIVRDVCGLNPVLEAPGFRKAVIKPQPCGYLKSASLSYRSASGTYRSMWNFIDDDTLEFEFEIPFNCEAEIILPDAALEGLTVRGSKPLSAQEMDGKVILRAEAGILKVSYMTTQCYIPHLSENSTLKDVLSSEAGSAVLHKYAGNQITRMERIPGLLQKYMNKPLTADPIFGVLSGLDNESKKALIDELAQCRVKI